MYSIIIVTSELTVFHTFGLLFGDQRWSPHDERQASTF